MDRAARWMAGMGGGLLVAGLLLWALARGAGPLPGDLALTRLLQAALPPWGATGQALLWLGNAAWFLPVIVIGVALLRRQWTAALFLLAAGLSSALLGEVWLKGLGARPRPAPDLVRVLEASSTSGFPSSTSFFALVVLGLTAYLVWQARPAAAGWRRSDSWSVAALALVLLTGLARVTTGAHWASDILGGWLFGGVWLLALVALHRWWLGRSQPSTMERKVHRGDAEGSRRPQRIERRKAECAAEDPSR